MTFPAYPRSGLRRRVIRSLAWHGWASLAGQTISWAATMFVIRLLEPSDYGLMASAGVLLGFLVALSELGLGAAVVQTRDLSRDDLRDLQILLLLVGVGSGVAMAAAGDVLAWYYAEPRLEALARVLAVVPPLTALSVLPQSLAVRELRFDTKAFADLGSALVGSVVTLTMAVWGAGVWSLVFGSMGNHATRTLVYAALQRGWLIPSLSLRGARRFLHFGFLASVDRMLWFVLSSVDVLILGRLLGETTLGVYVVALTLASLPLEKIAPVVTQVSFPAFAQLQGDLDQVRRSVLASARFGALVFVPIAWGGAMVAPAALPLLLGERWLDLVLPFQLICIVLPLRALSVLVSPALMGTGRVRTNIGNLLVSLAVMAPAFAIGSAYGLAGVALAWTLGYPIVFVATTIRAARALGLPLQRFVGACLPAVAGGIALTAAVSIANAFAGGAILSLAVAVPAGAVVYFGTVRLIDPGLSTDIRALLARPA